MILSRNVEVEVKAKLTSKNDRYSSFAAHDGDLGRWPRVVGVASQVLGGHHVVSAAVSLKDETDRVMEGILQETVSSCHLKQTLQSMKADNSAKAEKIQT